MAKKKKKLNDVERRMLAERKQQERIKFERQKRGMLGGLSNFRKSKLAKLSSRTAAYGSNYDDTVPYRTDSIQRNATFESRGDESLHRYFSAPRGIQVGLIGGESDNQIPLLDMVRNLAKDLDAQPATSLKKSVKRGFHIQATRRSLVSGVPFPEGVSKDQKDYLSQCNEYRPMADWTLNMGFRLELFGTNTNQFTVSERMKSSARQAVLRSESVREEMLSRYAMDSRRLEDVVTQAGFETIDFTDQKTNHMDSKLHDLTSWMCNSNDMLENTNLAFPLYGTSAILPRFDEVAFYMVSEKQENRKSGRYYSPGEYGLRYAREFFNPENRVVHFSIRGEIVSMKNSREEMRVSEDSAFDANEDTKYQEQVRLSQLRDSGKKLDLSSASSIAATNNPLIIDSFTLIAVRVSAGEEPPIVARLRDSTTYNLEVNPVAGNVPDAVHATLPGFNKPIFTKGRARAWSLKNSLATERTFPGKIFLSGVFNSSVPPVKSGIYLGLTNAFEEYKPFFLDTKQIASATIGENSPGILVTGRPDAGKTTLIKQIAKQAENNGEFCALLNFKSVDPLAPWWDEVIKDGAIVTIDPKLLRNKAGCLDPFNFYNRSDTNDWESIASTISGAISLLLRQNGEQFNTTSIDSAVTDNVRNVYAQCAGDVIFGTREHRKKFERLEEKLVAQNASEKEIITAFTAAAERFNAVPPLRFKEVRRIVADAINGSQHPFWRAFVADGVLVDQQIARAVNSGKPLLFEWGENFTPPSREVSLDAMTATEFDAVQSAMVVLGYVKRAANRFSRSTNKGGLIMMDEGAGALHIKEFAAEIERIMREFRAIGMRFLIGSQLINDIKPQIMSFCSLYIIGAISRSASDEEMKQFWRIAEIEQSKRSIAREFIFSAGRTREDDGGDIANRTTVERPIPYAWVVDQINNVNRPMLMGEYPLSVLTGAMSDAEAREIQRQLQEVSWSEKDEMVEEDREVFEIGYR